MEISAETQKATILAAYAKINLSLAVTGKAPNGYHTIDTVILPITLSDTVCVALADTVTVCYTDGRVYPDDVAYKTAKAICKRFGLSGISVRIDKRIPEGAGLGGSSADAAAVVRAIAALTGVQPDDRTLAAIGSDLPAMVRAKPVWVQGVGDRLWLVEPIDAPVAVAFRGKVDTGAAYALYDRIGGETGEIDAVLRGEQACFNALERAAVALNPSVGLIRQRMVEAGFARVVMTGSGSAVVAIGTKGEDFEGNCIRFRRLSPDIPLTVCRTLVRE